MDVVSAAASILAIAGAGIQISLKLIAFADQVGTAAKRIQDVGTDVSVTAGTLQELGELMNKSKSLKKSGGMFHPDQIQNIKASSDRCKGIFDDLKAVLGKASQQLRDVYKAKAKGQEGSMKFKLSRLERMKWPFLQPSIGPLQSGLRDAKSTLILTLQVVHLRHAQITASLKPDEQRDLIRMIAAMKRQQKASPPGDGSGYKGLDVGDTEDSDIGEYSAGQTVLEAWSVTPNTFANDAFQHLLIRPMPVSQQEIAKSLRTSPQDFRKIASMIDSLSTLERDAILGDVLNMRDSEDSTIRSIFSELWTGSHDLFGKVNARKFKVIVERRVRVSGFRVSECSMADLCSGSRPRMKMERYHHRSDASIHDSFSHSDSLNETGGYTYTSSPSPPFREHRRREREDRQREREDSAIECRRRRASPGSPISSVERRSDHVERRRPRENKRRPEGEAEVKKRLEERVVRISRMEKKEKKEVEHRSNWENSASRPGTEAQPTGELSDDDLVKSLLAQYTNFGTGEPLVRTIATPPPSYDESFALPKRDPRPY